ncbi:MAG TPA: CGNR zinc finger domain-containing protein [Gaiellales bacterium]
MAETTTRPLAPAPLRLVQEFVNSLDVETGQDLLLDRAGLTAWLGEHDLPGTGLDDADATAARELREALRALLRANAGGEHDPDAAARVNDVAARAPLRLELAADGAARLIGATGAGDNGVAPALGRILGAAYAAMADGSWPRLKACLDPECEWAFYDRSRNRSGHWCDMAVCGSRHKVRAYRARRHTAG